MNKVGSWQLNMKVNQDNQKNLLKLKPNTNKVYEKLNV
jgi:hypothetical protein